MTDEPSDWLEELAPGAPDVVAAYRGIDAGESASVRREVRQRVGSGTAGEMVSQLATLAETLSGLVATLPDLAFGLPGGEGDWTVAQAVGHDASARAGLVKAAALAAAGRWPANAPKVIPGVPGPIDAEREALIGRIATSQRIIARSARAVVGHETDPCPLDHPLVGRLRCGEWLLFAGVHDLMHLEQLHRLAAALAEPV